MKTVPGNSIVRELEYKIADYIDVRHVLAVCNASVGILGTFYSLGLRNAEVITTPLTWPGALSGLLMLDCKIKFCDVERRKLTLDPKKLEELITSNTKAVFTADFLGYPATLDEIKLICRKHRLMLIHDAASSFTSTYKGHYSGYFADITIFSFGANKLLSLGQGGCVVTNNSSIYKRLTLGLAHPEKQSILSSSLYNPFFLNTDINPFAAQHGLETFDKQIDKIVERKRNVYSWFKRVGFRNIDEHSEPNFYRILLPSCYKEKLSHTEIKIERLPFEKLIYQESNFAKFYTSDDVSCPVAASALKKFVVINNIQ